MIPGMSLVAKGAMHYVNVSFSSPNLRDISTLTLEMILLFMDHEVDCHEMLMK